MKAWSDMFGTAVEFSVHEPPQLARCVQITRWERTQPPALPFIGAAAVAPVRPDWGFHSVP